MALVFDYSGARPDPQTLIGNGCVGVMRYVATGPQNAWKVLGIPERNRLWAAGLPIGLVWEQDPGRPKAGYGAGVVDAEEANRQADRLGWPADVPIAYAVDFDPAGWLPQILDYFAGALSVGGRPVGDYGSFGVVEALARLEHNGRRVVCHWQCAGWSGAASVEPMVRLDGGDRRRRSLYACMVQDVEATRLPGTDVNHLYRPVDFLYHPDHARPTPERLQELTMQRLTHPHHPALANAEHALVVDGFGVFRRFGIPTPAAAGVLEKGLGYTGAVELTDAEADWFAALAPVGATPAEHGAFGLAGQIIGQLSAKIDGIDAAEAAGTAAAVAAAIRPQLVAAVREGVDAELDAAGDALSD